MKTLGIVTFMAGLLLALQFLGPASPSGASNTANAFGLVVLSKEGLAAGLGLVVVGLALAQRSRRKKKSGAQEPSG